MVRVLLMIGLAGSAHAQTAPPSHLKFESKVSREHRDGINQALASLYKVQVKQPDAKLLKVLKISDSTPATLNQWLQARTRYIVSQDYSIPESVVEVGSTSGNDPQIAMANIGTAVYLVAKTHQLRVALKIDGVGTIPVTSPRVGILMVGPGLFADNGLKLPTIISSLERVSTLFHEARHSDGNGNSLGFRHVECPQGHDYAGHKACDVAGNGPYTVDALVTSNLRKSCTDCTIRGSEYLRLLQIDFANRLISPDAPDMDDRPEGTAR